ncbi:MAG TPA: aldehyde dehydrogenase family protein, partial [Candidatus Acidoferrum sp.]|nr:aldehyde dehydrogenase family protein [Candidatus Acidoferrum sp.]
IEESVADEWVDMLVKRANNFAVGNGLDPATDMGPLVDHDQMNAVLRYIETGKKEADLRCGGERLTGQKYDKGWFVAPTVFDHVPPNSVIAQEEIFGPVLSVIRVRNFDEAVAAANSVRYGLASSIYTTDANKIFEFVDRSEAGMVHVNSPTVGGEAHVAFGGTKGTSVGPKEVGRSALDFYSEVKVVYVDYTGRKRESSVY